MTTLYTILALLGSGLIIFYLYKVIKGQPEQFSKENLNKSFLTMGILACILIAFVALLVATLRV
jgi:hypothetical protein